jgi:predicted alpha/beta-fold hydrolase
MADAEQLKAALQALPPFRPRRPWIGGDLQTVRNFLLRPRPPIERWPTGQIDFDMADGTGDRLVGFLQRPEGSAERPLVMLVHGLTGSSESIYVRVSTFHLLCGGYPVLRLNLRGAGPTSGKTQSFYHAGRTDDLRRAIEGLGTEAPRGLVAAGYSLGANLILKYLAEQGDAAPVLGAVAISAPIDLQSTQRCIALLRNRLYHRHLLQEMKAERGHGVPADIRTILDFDNRIVAPAHGFADALDYYRRCSSAPLLSAIRRPTFILHAADDPWIPAEAYRLVDWSANPDLIHIMLPSGGHVGFHAQGLDMPWHDAAMIRFLDALDARPA